MYRDSCLVCERLRLHRILDLGMHALADTFVPMDRLSEPEPRWPLQIDLCEACGQVQTAAHVPAAARYVDTDYAYTASNSATARQHWCAFAEATDYGRHGGRVLEIGSNDGYLLQCYTDQGWTVCGVDAAPRMRQLAATRGIDTITAPWGTGLVPLVVDRLQGNPDLVVANNVLNHANDPVDFVTAVRAVLAEDGLFVLEVPAWTVLLDSGHFDQIYHEHVTYWTSATITQLCRRAGLFVQAIEPVDYHGGSLRVFVRKTAPGGDFSAAARFRDRARYAAFQHQLFHQRDAFWRTLLADTRPIVAVGAAAKANTFLQYYQLDHTRVGCITDASREKQGKWTPGTRIPIVADDALAGFDQPRAICTAWNLTAVLQAQLALLNPTLTWLNPWSPV